MFPSPCGDYGSYLLTKTFPAFVKSFSFRPLAGIMVLIRQANSLKKRGTLCFRPLAGIMVLIRMSAAGFNKLLHEVSVPLRGLWFLSQSSEPRPLTRVAGFRPLAGIMVLIRTLYKCLYEAVEMAFCGADHIFSSFFVFCKKMIFKKSFRLEF